MGGEIIGAILRVHPGTPCKAECRGHISCLPWPATRHHCHRGPGNATDRIVTDAHGHTWVTLPCVHACSHGGCAIGCRIDHFPRPTIGITPCARLTYPRTL